MLITIVAGARPNFMKVAPVIDAIKVQAEQGVAISYRLVHTGQHYDKKMSGDFFEQLGIPEPDSNLGAGSGTQAEQTAAIMIGFEKELLANPSDLVLVVGDVTSTMACSIVAKKLQILVAHIEGGIRSNDWSMPEEINRLVTDSISDYFFTTSDTANKNLIQSGVSNERIFFVGNTMIDTLYRHIDSLVEPTFWKSLKLEKSNYVVMTLHRPSNVDNSKGLTELLEVIIKSSRGLPIIFPIHPRSAKNVDKDKFKDSNLFFVDPLNYLEFNFLVKNSKAVITDSGGITEETTVMGVPCMTLRDNTERPETCEIGTNELLGTDPKAILPAFNKLFAGAWKKGRIPDLWDGKTSERIVEKIIHLI